MNSITGLELVDCDRIKAFEIGTAVSKIASKYYEKNLPQLYYTQNILKILCQLFAHSSSPNMTLYPYASFLIEQARTTNNARNPLFWDSQVIKGIIYSLYSILIHSSFFNLRRYLFFEPSQLNRFNSISIEEYGRRSARKQAIWLITARFH